ncbi:hypothetical protein QC764_605810 [Podospora pseudoanserina]|uniref:Uncharacterized protein n=1 Tax=Podospora pseudoanserina TaxID=2609844 RepID=A0ABR0HSE8_9PEZI|nr:hypothetical protein QC764_605810 [Podospora pseudoanserina]
MSTTNPYGYTMAATYDQGLEPARHDYPEVTDPSHCAPEYVPPQPLTNEPMKPYGSTYVTPAAPYELSHTRESSSVYGGHAATAAPPYDMHDQVRLPASPPTADLSSSMSSEKPPSHHRKKTIFGCTTLVFVLSCIIALLSMAVIGLAAAAGMEAHRANTNASRIAVMLAESNSTSGGLESVSDAEPEPGTGSGSDSNTTPGSTRTVTVTVSAAAAATETVRVTPASAISAVDDGCSENPEKVHGSTYTSYKRFNSLKFTRYCQRDPDGSLVMVIFTSTFEQCMDACASYSTYVAESFPTGGAKTRCDGVSFIPEWADKAAAGKENSRGNCYLKSGVKGEGGENGKKVKVHAAILQG